MREDDGIKTNADMGGVFKLINSTVPDMGRPVLINGEPQIDLNGLLSSARATALARYAHIICEDKNAPVSSNSTPSVSDSKIDIFFDDDDLHFKRGGSLTSAQQKNLYDFFLDDLSEANGHMQEICIGEPGTAGQEPELERNACGDVIDPKTKLPKVNIDEAFKL